MTNAMSAGLLRRVVDIVQRYRAVLRSDELVQTRRRGLAVDGDDVFGRPCPGDIWHVERAGEQADDVFGSVGEVIADAHDAAVVRDDATAVAVNHAEHEFL